MSEAITCSPMPTLIATPLDVDDNIFPAFITPPDSSKPPLFLAGAGVRGLEIGGNFVKFSAIGVYLDASALSALSAKWAGKTADQLAAAPDFYMDLAYGPFDKFTRVTLIRLLTGDQYTDKVCENCENQWKAAGIDVDFDVLTKLKQVFKPETFPPGASIFFTHASSGTLSIAFSEDDSVPETSKAVIENRALSCGILESIIGENGVSPAAKRSLAIRICELLKSHGITNNQEVAAEKEMAVAVDA